MVRGINICHTEKDSKIYKNTQRRLFFFCVYIFVLILLITVGELFFNVYA